MHKLYGNSLREFILALHDVDIVWLPSTPDEEPPF
jgi:hypothetical protein